MENLQNNWENNDIVLDTPVKEHTIVLFSFKATKDLDIESIIPSCGCISPLYSKSTKTLNSSFSTGSIPTHLVNQGFYLARKNIRIVYADKSDELLTFSCKVER